LQYNKKLQIYSLIVVGTIAYSCSSLRSIHRCRCSIRAGPVASRRRHETAAYLLTYLLFTILRQSSPVLLRETAAGSQPPLAVVAGCQPSFLNCVKQITEKHSLSHAFWNASISHLCCFLSNKLLKIVSHPF